MTNANVFQLCQPRTFADPLTEILRNGARALLAQAVEAEVAVLLASHADKLTDDGRQRLVRHGHLPEREIMTGIGPVRSPCAARVYVTVPVSSSQGVTVEGSISLDALIVSQSTNHPISCPKIAGRCLKN